MDLGAVPTQNNNFGREYVVVYALQSNYTAEANYSIYKGETLEVVWAIAHFRPYFNGQRFILVTDHQPLRCLMELDKLTGKLARWFLLLMENDFEVVRHVGIINVDADVFSHNSSPSDDDLTRPGDMEIVIERRLLVGTQLLTSLYFLSRLLRFRYSAWMMRLIDLKLLRIYGEIFPYCISFSRGPFLCLAQQ